MKSIKELYRIGTGPSSSHTMGPRKAAQIFLERHPEAAAFQVTLYGSLAATGKGHMTNVAITSPLRPKVCAGLQASAEMCGNSRQQAMTWLIDLEMLTAP